LLYALEFEVALRIIFIRAAYVVGQWFEHPRRASSSSSTCPSAEPGHNGYRVICHSQLVVFFATGESNIIAAENHGVGDWGLGIWVADWMGVGSWGLGVGIGGWGWGDLEWDSDYWPL
jgi:hypothetical protein